MCPPLTNFRFNYSIISTSNHFDLSYKDITSLPDVVCQCETVLISKWCGRLHTFSSGICSLQPTSISLSNTLELMTQSMFVTPFPTILEYHPFHSENAGVSPAASSLTQQPHVVTMTPSMKPSILTWTISYLLILTLHFSFVVILTATTLNSGMWIL